MDGESVELVSTTILGMHVQCGNIKLDHYFASFAAASSRSAYMVWTRCCHEDSGLLLT